jgi:hypothetical protein
MRKFSIDNISDYDILKYAVIGFEFEFFCEKPYYKLLEYLNRELGEIKVRGFSRYHSKFKPSEKIFKIEPDYSLGNSGVELITGPQKYVNSRIILLKILKIIQDFGRTNDKCSIHINVSFDVDEVPYKSIELVNKLKLILDIDENLIYRSFPEREYNFYAKSIKRLIPFKKYDFSIDAVKHLKNNIELPDTKYYGVNTNPITEGRLEFRYIGGTSYQDKVPEILDLMDYFVIKTWNCINEDLTKENMDNLMDYLTENISNFKKYKTYEDFISEFPTIKLQVDKDTTPITIKTYYDSFYEKLFDLINNIYNLQDCIINYNTENKKLEIVDAEFKTIFDVKNVDLIECTIEGGSFYRCNIVNSQVSNSHIYKSIIMNSDIFNSKIDSSKIDSTSIVNNCYLFNSLLDGGMNGGVFRSGKIGENAEIADDVEIITRTNSYFGVKQDDDIEKSKKKDDKNKWLK